MVLRIFAEDAQALKLDRSFGGRALAKLTASYLDQSLLVSAAEI